ncbi:MAG: hypothetical protein ACTHXY_11770 [Brevibacterium aurantiacum]|uniref:hypothetical protein n=1 Tax=Brevibacterium aurantiacum TaxID=273384 RepID=UPI0011C07928|nr:hypothetical protein [Brevibacterium aurantiacum]
MDADIWISALEDLAVVLAVLHIVVAAILGWITAVIAKFPIWAGIVLCVFVPVVGFLIMATTALVRQISRFRGSVSPRTSAPRVAVRVGLAAVPGLAFLLLCATLALPWFRVPLDKGFPLKVAGSVIGAEAAVLTSAGLLICAIALAACLQPLWSSVVQTLNAGFWAAVSAVVLVLLTPVQALLRDYAKLSMTVDDGLTRVGVGEDGVPSIPELPIPEPIVDFVPFLQQGPIDIGGIDIAHYLPRFGIQLGISWWFVFAATALTIGFSLWSAYRGTQAASRRSRPHSATNIAPTPEPAIRGDTARPAEVGFGSSSLTRSESHAVWEQISPDSQPTAPPVSSSSAPDFDDPWKDVI